VGGSPMDSAATRRLDRPSAPAAAATQVAPASDSTRVMGDGTRVMADGTRVMEAGLQSPSPAKDKPVAGRVRVPGQNEHPDGYSPGRSAGPPPGRGPLPRLKLSTDPEEPSERELDKADRPPLLGPPGSLSKGFELSVIGGLFSLIMWLIWAIQQGMDTLRSQVFSYLFVLAVAVGLFFLIRIAGGILWGRWLHAKRKSARLAHLATGIFLFMVGMSYLDQLSWNWISLDFGWFDWITDLFGE
jgi:hypothetical protein